MKQTVLIALLALAGFTALPAVADTAAPAPAAIAPATPDNLSAPGKPCIKPGMGGMPGMGAGMGAGMPPGMRGMMMGEGRPCPKSGTPCDYKHHTDMSARLEQLEKRLDALQLTLEVLVRQQDE